MTNNRSLEKLGAHQVQLQSEKDRTTNAIETIRANILVAARPVTAIRRRWPLVAATAAAVLLVSLAAWIGWPLVADKPVRTDANKWVFASNTGPRTLLFSDQSEVTLKPGARGRVLEEAGTHVRLLLETGTALFNVTPTRHTDWRIEAGPYTVLVTGTRFQLSWQSDPQELSIKMHKGAVMVEGPMLEGGARVVADQQLRVNAARRTLEISPIGQSTAVARSTPILNQSVSSHSSNPDDSAHSVANKSKRRPLPGPKPSNEKNADWRQMNRIGQTDRVLAEARARGIDKVLTAETAQNLMALADAARLHREPLLSKRVFDAVRTRFAGTRLAADAAFHLGKIAFNQQGHYDRAAALFRTYLTEQPTGPLARAALGIMMTCDERAGKPNQARKSAQTYLERYPDGPHAQHAKRLVAKSR